MLKILRFNIWWNTIVPQVLGWIYFCILSNSFTSSSDTPSADTLFRVGFFFTSLICIASFGYLLNDWCDIKSDAFSGKANLLSQLHPVFRFILVLLPLLTGCIVWKPYSEIATLFFALQIISLTIYSIPPFRLKNRGIGGVLADAFYAHINPVLITLFAFNFFSENITNQKNFFSAVLTAAVALKGIRNILIHQLDDRKKDRKAGIKTFVIKNGSLFTLSFINNFLPFEIFFTLALVVSISISFPPFLLSLLLFALLSYLKFSGWKLAYLPKRQLKFKFLYFLNDYYEGWVPVFFLILLSVHNPAYLFLLLLHLALFPSFITNLWKDFQAIKQNFATEEEY